MGWMLMWFSAQSNGSESPIKRALRHPSLKWNFNESSLSTLETNQMKSSLTMRAWRRRFCRLVGLKTEERLSAASAQGMLGGTLNLFIVRLVRALFVFYRKPIHARAAWGIPLYNICWANAREFTVLSLSRTELRFIDCTYTPTSFKVLGETREDKWSIGAVPASLFVIFPSLMLSQ